MLIGINPLLHGRLLSVLDALGHTDHLLIADGNFPASQVGVPAYRIGAGTLPALDAVLSVFPVDDDDGKGVTVRPSREDGTLDELQSDAQQLADRFVPGIRFEVPSRERFRERLGAVRALIMTTDAAPSCYLLRKGVVRSTG